MRQNSHDKINHLKVNRSVEFSVFTGLYDHCLSLVTKPFHHPKRKLPTHQAVALHSWQLTPPLVPGYHPSAFYLYGFAHSVPFIEMESYTTGPFVSNFSHIASCFQGPSMWQQVLVLPSFLRPKNKVPLYGCATFHLSIYWLMDIWVVSTFWQ